MSNNTHNLLETQNHSDDEETPIPLPSRVVHRFYEPIVLLLSLFGASKAKGLTACPPPDPAINIKDPKQVFYAYVNKLSNVCDRTRGGDTVTSFTILNGDNAQGGFHYWLAANRQTKEQLEITVAFVRALLLRLDQAPIGRDNQHMVRRELLSDILRFNRPRVSVYLRAIRLQTEECLRRCYLEETDDNRLIIQELTEILDSTTSVGASLEHQESEYIRKCEETIRLLLRLYQSKAGPVITKRALDARMLTSNSAQSWSDFVHTTKRILAYPQSVQFFLLVKNTWPQLFHGPEVSSVPSSAPIPKPFRNKSLSADSIVGRMTGKEKQIQIFRNFVQTLQMFDLDDRIKAEYGKNTFRPIVHAELLLLNHLKTHGGFDASRFFSGWMYIGSSKPTCKLCDIYFQESRSGVDRRPCHSNLYICWRVPDVFPSQGQEALHSRQVMVDRILQRVRGDAFEMVRQKVPPQCKDNDSATFSATISLEERWTLDGSAADNDDLESIMGNIDISEAGQDFSDGYSSKDVYQIYKSAQLGTN